MRIVNLTLADAKQTPLIELLRNVPESARALHEISEYEHQNVPYGRLMNDAADEIERLRARVAELEADAARYRWLRKARENWYVLYRDDEDSNWIDVHGWDLDAAILDAAIDAARGSRGNE